MKYLPCNTFPLPGWRQETNLIYLLSMFKFENVINVAKMHLCGLWSLIWPLENKFVPDNNEKKNTEKEKRKS